MTDKIYIKNKIIPDYIFEDLLFDLKEIEESEAEVAGGTQLVDKQVRSCVSKWLRYKEYPDICKVLENSCSSIHMKHIPSELICLELQYLKYGISDHFKAHSDVVNGKKPRRFSTVTMLSKTEDLEGGDLIIFDEDGNEINTNIDVGETVVFYSSTLHQVTPITKGGREVLVGWIYDR